MNRTRMLVLATVALALSVVVTFMTYRVLRNRLRPPDEMTTAVVLTERAALGTRLTAEHLRLAPWPKAAMLPGIFHDVAQVVDRGVIVPMEANEPVLESRLASKEAGAGLTTAIPEGMRAISIRVNDVISVAGFVVPGTRVDVILTGTPPNPGTAGDVSKIILENVQVLTAGQNVDSDKNGHPQTVPVVTLLVTPQDAQKLALASSEGRMQLALRNPLDTESKNPPLVLRASLYSGSAAPPTSLPAPAPARAAGPVRIVTVTPRPPAAAPTPVPAVVPPRKLQVQLIQGKTSETFTFVKVQPD